MRRPLIDAVPNAQGGWGGGIEYTEDKTDESGYSSSVFRREGHLLMRGGLRNTLNKE
jgi:hypothetical protein